MQGTSGVTLSAYPEGGSIGKVASFYVQGAMLRRRKREIFRDNGGEQDFIQKIATIKGYHSWYRPYGPRPVSVKLKKKLFFFFKVELKF